MNKNQKQWFIKIWNDPLLKSLKNDLFTVVRRNCYGLNQKEFLLFTDNYRNFKRELFSCIHILVSKYLINTEDEDLQKIEITIDQIGTIYKPWLEKREPIKWMGTQKEFAELIIELQKKNWIKNDSTQSINNTAKEFATHFDISGTKKNNNSNEINSLYQLLKPQQSKELDYEKKYPQIYSKRYAAKFKDVKERKIK